MPKTRLPACAISCLNRCIAEALGQGMAEAVTASLIGDDPAYRLPFPVLDGGLLSLATAEWPQVSASMLSRLFAPLPGLEASQNPVVTGTHTGTHYTDIITIAADQPLSGSADQPISRSTGQPTSRSADQPISRSAEQLNRRSEAKPISSSTISKPIFRVQCLCEYVYMYSCTCVYIYVYISIPMFIPIDSYTYMWREGERGRVHYLVQGDGILHGKWHLDRS